MVNGNWSLVILIKVLCVCDLWLRSVSGTKWFEVCVLFFCLLCKSVSGTVEFSVVRECGL